MGGRKYPALGRCIFCGSTTKELTKEHVVPCALSGNDQIVIEKGSCTDCNGYANEAYEQPSLNSDFLQVRHMLELKRKKRSPRDHRPRRLPLVSYTDNVDEVADKGYDAELIVSRKWWRFSFAVLRAV